MERGRISKILKEGRIGREDRIERNRQRQCEDKETSRERSMVEDQKEAGREKGELDGGRKSG